MFQYVRRQSLEYFIALCLFTECVATLVTKSSHSGSQIITTLVIPQLLLYFGRSARLLPESLWLPPKLPACFFTITSFQSIFNKTVRLLLLQSMCGHVPPLLTYIFHSKSQSPCKNLKHQGLCLLPFAVYPALSLALSALWHQSSGVSNMSSTLLLKSVEGPLWAHCVHFPSSFPVLFSSFATLQWKSDNNLQKHFFICKMNAIDCRNCNNDTSWCYQKNFSCIYCIKVYLLLYTWYKI